MEIEFKRTVKELSLEFSLFLIEYEKHLAPKQKGNTMKQLIRSGTSIGANIREAQGPESSKDFVHKMKIAYKEAEETEYWLLIQNQSFPSDEIKLLLRTLVRIKQMLGKILSTSSKNNLLNSKK